MFLSRKYRPNKWPFYVLLTIEFCLTVGLLALVGIASPNLYRTKLWQDGADNGFNSSPITGLYAAANYRPYTTPKVWSQFITNYNVVVVVLSMFVMLVKGIMYMLHVWPPVCNAVLHAVLIALYTVSIYYQASSDTTDPTRPQSGPAWYITKSCSVASKRSNVGYCQQAKATFACFCVMLAIFIIYFGISVWSCFPSKTHKAEVEEKRRLKKERWAHLDELNDKHGDAVGYPVPHTPGFQGGLNPMTPRTLAFNTLGGTKNQSMKKDVEMRTATESPVKKSSLFALRSPGLPRSPLSKNFDNTTKMTTIESPSSASTAQPAVPMFFPPPPKKSQKN